MVGVAAGGADEAVKPAGARDVGRQRDWGRDFGRVWDAEEPITLMFDKSTLSGIAKQRTARRLQRNLMDKSAARR